MPEDSGSTRPSTICTATAASTAEPPRRRTSAPASAASGCAAATSARFAACAAHASATRKRAAAAALTGLHHQRNDEQRDDIDDLDERVHRRAGRVLVGIAHRVASYGRLVRVRALAAVMTVFDVLLRVVPGTATGAHRDRDEKPRHDRAHEYSAERLRARGGPGGPGEAEADDDRHEHRKERRHHHLADGRARQHVDGD